MGSCTSTKVNMNINGRKKHSISSKKTSASADQLPGLMKLEIACMEFEHRLKQDLEQLQKVFESNQKTIASIIEKGSATSAARIQGSSLKLLNSMNQIKIYQILLECCSAIEDDTHNLSQNIISDNTKMFISNIVWSAQKLRNLECLQDFKSQLENFIDPSKTNLHYLIDADLRALFSKLSDD